MVSDLFVSWSSLIHHPSNISAVRILVISRMCVSIIFWREWSVIRSSDGERRSGSIKNQTQALIVRPMRRPGVVWKLDGPGSIGSLLSIDPVFSRMEEFFHFNFLFLTLMIGARAELTTCCSFCNIPDDGRDSNVRDWRLLTAADWYWLVKTDNHLFSVTNYK